MPYWYLILSIQRDMSRRRCRLCCAGFCGWAEWWDRGHAEHLWWGSSRGAGFCSQPQSSSLIETKQERACGMRLTVPMFEFGFSMPVGFESRWITHGNTLDFEKDSWALKACNACNPAAHFQVQPDGTWKHAKQATCCWKMMDLKTEIGDDRGEVTDLDFLKSEKLRDMREMGSSCIFESSRVM